MGTPEQIEANAIPPHMRDVVITRFAKKTTMAIATVFETWNLASILFTTLSKYGLMATAAATLAGRMKLLNTQNPAYTARKFFHCPGARGLFPVCLEKMYHAIETDTVYDIFDTHPYDRTAANPNFASRWRKVNFSPSDSFCLGFMMRFQRGLVSTTSASDDDKSDEDPDSSSPGLLSSSSEDASPEADDGDEYSEANC